MKEDKEYIIPLDEEATEKLSKQIIKHIDFKSVELQERIDKAVEILNGMKHADRLLEGYSRISNIDKVLNILQGKDENK